ncbi:uncharacterized protein WM277_023463 isoform 1-T1 [Molossus nigricans]
MSELRRGEGGSEQVPISSAVPPPNPQKAGAWLLGRQPHLPADTSILPGVYADFLSATPGEWQWALSACPGLRRELLQAQHGASWCQDATQKQEAVSTRTRHFLSSVFTISRRGRPRLREADPSPAHRIQCREGQERTEPDPADYLVSRGEDQSWLVKK